MEQTRKDDNLAQNMTEKIPEEEPVFLLRASDVAAPEAVREWARVNCMLGGDPYASAVALEVADAMELWQEEQNCNSDGEDN